MNATSTYADSDILLLTGEQLAEFRPGSKVLIAARIDGAVHNRLQQYGEGYSTLSVNILRAVTEQSRKGV